MLVSVLLHSDDIHDILSNYQYVAITLFSQKDPDSDNIQSSDLLSMSLCAAWDSYHILRQFWLNSFASSTVDIRAHRYGCMCNCAHQEMLVACWKLPAVHAK